jgi:mycoredoxin
MKKIVVYGTSWCPDCTQAKQVFSQYNIKYKWYDIEQNKKACAYVEQVNNGNQSVPTILFPDGSILVEPSNATLTKKLAEYQ